MKKFYLLFSIIIISVTATAQNKEKIKGSKNVTVTQRELATFEKLEVEDNLEVFLIKGAGESIEIEADDNLHEIIQTDMNGSTLRIYTSKQANRYEKLTVRVTYTNNLKNITARHETILNALADLELDTIAVENLDYSKSFMNVKAKKFSLKMNDKTEAELNLKAEESFIELSKKAELKALVASASAKFDLYQETSAIIEGDAANAIIRLDNSAVFTGKKFTVKNLELMAEGYSTNTIMAAENLTITATGKSETLLYGSPKVEVKNFTNNAIIYKKEL